MAVADYKKYKVSLNPDSNKTQGLRTGDIVRRQYFDGQNIIYSLMCVLDYGETEITVQEPIQSENGQYAVDENNNIQTVDVTKKQPWFIGALLEGDEPKSGEILDFVRVTNLFDTDRSGALYLTASDDDAPFMDVIDGIGRNCSLSWPENLAVPDPNLADAKTQYCITGNPKAKEYICYEDGRNRICHLTQGISSLGLKQTFYEYINEHKSINQIAVKNQVVISYWVKTKNAPQSGTEISIKLGYADNSRTDGTIREAITEDWEYKFHVITVENSGRHLRALTMDFTSLLEDQEIFIADFNVILLSSLANYGEASQIRVGRLSGIVDPVFGKLDGYGSYLQKLFASSSAHISGTLTAGDENGFAATFYAGKIHKNAFLNSLEVHILNGVQAVNLSTEGILNPTGIGQVYGTDKAITVLAQTADWLSGAIDTKSKIGKLYCFSFWAYTTTACQLSICQDSKVVGTINIGIAESRGWHRHHVVVEIQEPEYDDLIFSIKTAFEKIEGEESIPNKFYFTAPQLESGYQVTQYQPTDDTLSYCEDYGAWFNRGGIGGTIQNPLLRLNADGEGAIASRSNSFRLNQNGSGHVAKGNIKWNENGDVEFGENVRLNWGNLGDDTQHRMENKLVRIDGADTFAVIGNSKTGALYSPDYVTLTLQETNIYPKVEDREWLILRNGKWESIVENIGLSHDRTSFIIYPDDTSLWEERDTSLTLKYRVVYQEHEYTDTVTIRKYSIDGYTVVITSSKGETFRNGVCDTILKADVYYQGELVPEDFITEHFTYCWHKYHLPDTENEIENWWIEETISDTGKPHTSVIDRFSKTLPVSGEISGSDVYICEILTKEGASFPYYFPILF